MNKAASGRPVRFFTLVIAGWVTIRLAGTGFDLLGDEMDGPGADPFRPTTYATNVEITTEGHGPPVRQSRPPSRLTSAAAAPGPTLMASSPWARATRIKAALAPAAPATKEAASTEEVSGKVMGAAPSINPSPALPLAYPPAAGIGRWHGSAWLLWRDGSAPRADAATGGRLGGSQAGFRLDFDLTPRASSRATVYARTSAALNKPVSPEGALGLAWQPARTVPISFAAERRFALGQGGRNANAVLAVGGFGPTRVAPSLEIEAYAQSGMVGFRSRDLFVDGKISLLSPLGNAPVRLGASLSGGAQPQVERLDIGPELQIRLPIKPVGARLSVEWRERIAGRAAPASGPAVTLGADF